VIEVKSYSQEPLEDILDAALRIYPKAKFNRGDPEDQKRLIQMCIRNGDLSVFTHASAKIEITCSQCVAQELLSNNNDVTIKSYMPNGHELQFITPREFSSDDKLKSIFSRFIKKIIASVKDLSETGSSVDYRYILPGCIQTEVLISSSFLGFLQILKLEKFNRTSRELAEICSLIYTELNKICEPVFNKTNLKFKI